MLLKPHANMSLDKDDLIAFVTTYDEHVTTTRGGNIGELSGCHGMT